MSNDSDQCCEDMTEAYIEPINTCKWSALGYVEVSSAISTCTPVFPLHLRPDRE
jgi:hypothetical protein